MPDNYYSKELEAPFQAPRWTLSGYQGSLKAAVQNACGEIPSDTINVSGTRTSDVRSSQPSTHTPDEQQLLQQIRSSAAPADDADDADEQRLLQLIRSSQNSANTPAALDEPPTTSSTQTTSRPSTQTSSDLPDLIPPFRTESRSLSGSKKRKKKSKKDN